MSCAGIVKKEEGGAGGCVPAVCSLGLRDTLFHLVSPANSNLYICAVKEPANTALPRISIHSNGLLQQPHVASTSKGSCESA